MLRVLRAFAFLLLCSPVLAFAGNPVSFTLVPASGFPATTYVGSSYAVAYTLTNNLPFPVTISAVTRTVTGSGGYSVADACSGVTLAAQGTCTVHITSHPTAAGTDSIQLTLHYDRNVVPLPALSSNVLPVATEEMSGHVSDPLNSRTVVGTNYAFEFTYTNIGNTAITATSASASASNGTLSGIVNGCVTAVQPNNSCTIVGLFKPSAAGAASVSANFVYDGGKQVPLETQTTAETSGGGFVDGIAYLTLPASTYQYADNVVKFVFTNEHDVAGATLGTVILSGKLGSINVTTWITTGTDQCSGKTLALNSSCSVYASVVPKLTGSNLTIEASLPYTIDGKSETATASTTSTSVLANDTTNRMVTVINQCPFPVWMTFQAGAVSPAYSGHINPHFHCPCATGSTCNTANNTCYFSNPSLDGNHPNGLLKAATAGAAPDTMNISISENFSGPNPFQNILYNGGIVARTGCTGSGSSLFCAVNNCGGTVTPVAGSTDANGMCAPGVSGSNTPGISFSAAELTFVTTGTEGVYDETALDGVNVPIEIKGRGPMSGLSLPNYPPYNECEPTGAVIQPTTIVGSPNQQLGGCTYNYSGTPTTTPSGAAPLVSSYRFVIPTGTTACTSSSDCTGSQVCGTAYLSGTTTLGQYCMTPCTLASDCSGTNVCGLAYNSNSTKLGKFCGTLTGYVSVNKAICAQTGGFDSNASTLQSDYQCSAPTITAGGGSYTAGNLFAGAGGTPGLGSCYSYSTPAGTTSQYCTGCVDWWNVSGITAPNQTGVLDQSCTNFNPGPNHGVTFSNPNWTSIVQPQIQYVKTACPTAYSYQYDDKTSSFTCTIANGGKTVTNYQVTFCPGGATISDPYPTS